MAGRRLFTIRCYGAMDLRVAASSKKAAIKRVNKVFDKENAVDPLSGRQINEDMMSLGFLILCPNDTQEFRHVDPFDV